MKLSTYTVQPREDAACYTCGYPFDAHDKCLDDGNRLFCGQKCAAWAQERDQTAEAAAQEPAR